MDDFCENHSNFSWANGACKVCLICEDNDDSYVLKTAFAGLAYEPEDENGEVIEDEDWEFSSRTEEDDCLVEYLVYKAAVAAHVDQFFAETIELGSGVYMQQKYDMPFCDKSYKELYDDLSSELRNLFAFEEEYTPITFYKVKDVAKEVGLTKLAKRLDTTTFIALYANYSIRELLELQDFLETYCINDLHSGNIGYFYDELKFVDYCGCGSNTSSIILEKNR